MSRQSAPFVGAAAAAWFGRCSTRSVFEIRHNLQKDISLPVVFELESVFGLPAHKLVFEYEQEGIYTKGF